MAEEHHPVRLAAISASAAFAAATALFFTWVQPAMMASVTHEKGLLEEKVHGLEEEIASVRAKVAEVEGQRDEAARSASMKDGAFREVIKRQTDEIASLKGEVVRFKFSNILPVGNVYPVGLDKVKIGDSKDHAKEIYGTHIDNEGRTYFNVKNLDEIFTSVRVDFRKTNAGVEEVSGIVFDTSRFRGLSKTEFPVIPNDWIQETLERSLGHPFVIGPEKSCLMWLPGDKLFVFYEKGDSAYHVSFGSYPPACFMTDDDKKEYLGTAKKPSRSK